jgi:hypothetical protein
LRTVREPLSRLAVLAPNPAAASGTRFAMARCMTDLRVQLTKDHEELEALLRCLSEDTAAPECGALQTTWCQFETRLLAHMDTEERYLLPLLETSNAVETARIRADHARIRQLVSELGVSIELHTARKPGITQLISLLRTHAEYEDRVLYDLASQQAPAHIRDKISAALEAAAHFALTAAVGKSQHDVAQGDPNRRAQP